MGEAGRGDGLDWMRLVVDSLGSVAILADGGLDREMSLFDGLELMTVNSERRQSDGNEPVAALVRHDDALRLARDFDDYGPKGRSPVEIGFLHGWMLHLRVGPELTLNRN
jgi:hypothetical protein